MAVNPYPALKFKIQPLFSESAQYRRREPEPKAKKVQRKFRVKIRHAALSFLGVVALFVGIQQGLLFLMGWDRLTIEHIEVRCPKPELKTAAELWMADHVPKGNLWALNLKHLRRSLEAHPWIKAVQVRKHFPATLSVEITQRVPAALLLKDSLVLIDREGVELAPAAQSGGWNLPLFIDHKGFQNLREEKLDQAWRFLDQLTPQDRTAIKTVDVSLFTDLRAQRRDFPSLLLFGKGEFAVKMKNFHAERSLLESQLPLESVDLSRTDRVVWKPLPGNSGTRAAPERR